MADPKAKDINSVADMEKAFPGQINAVRNLQLAVLAWLP